MILQALLLRLYKEGRTPLSQHHYFSSSISTFAFFCSDEEINTS
jgi:hypothetical protein